MSYIQSYITANPDGIDDECTEAYVDSPATLRLSNCITGVGKYTLQFYIKSNLLNYVELETDGLNATITTSTEWTKYVYTFDVSEVIDGGISLSFQAGIYYLYHVKLEEGDTATDWTPAPEDVALFSANSSVSDTRLFRLSDRYSDKLGCDNGIWYIERNTQLMTLDGTEDGWEQIIHNIYRLKLSDRGEANSILPALSDHFTYSSKNFLNMPVNSMHVANISYNGVQTTFLHIRVDESIATTTLSWCEWLESNPVTILIPAESTTIVRLANYLQTSLNNVVGDSSVNISLGNDVHSLTGAVLVKPLVFGTVNSDMSALINNASDDEIGFIYQITCKGEVYDPVIYHHESNSHIKINGNFKLNDVITIDTRRGHKSITKAYGGKETNIINSLDNTSKWLQLQSGYNHLIQSAELGADLMASMIIYTNEYEGV